MSITQISSSALAGILVAGLFIPALCASAPSSKRGTSANAGSDKQFQTATPTVGAYVVYQGGKLQAVSVQTAAPAKASVSAPVSLTVNISGDGNPSGPIAQKSSAPGNSPAVIEYPWKVPTPFEISFVDGFTGVYPIGEQIVFHVEGRSPVKVDALPNNGFAVSAAIYDVPRSRIIQSVVGNFDEARRAWQLAFSAPSDNSISYEVEIHLYCGKDESQCAEIYGRAAQTTKRLTLIVN